MWRIFHFERILEDLFSTERKRVGVEEESVETYLLSLRARVVASLRWKNKEGKWRERKRLIERGVERRIWCLSKRKNNHDLEQWIIEMGVGGGGGERGRQFSGQKSSGDSETSSWQGGSNHLAREGRIENSFPSSTTKTPPRTTGSISL